MSEFSDRPFVAGSLFGLRAFEVDNLGRLTGVTHKDVWLPGENQAVCHSDRNAQLWQSAQTWSFIVQQTSVGAKEKGRKLPMPKLSEQAVSDKPDLRKHEMAALRCTCGFYAYFDGGNDYLRSGGGYTSGGTAWSVAGYTAQSDSGLRVAGIVEGWGKVVVGSRGFRAERARIAALVLNNRSTGRDQVLINKVRRNYSVPVFDSEGDALREFPLTDPQPLTPDSCDDFWTRSA